MTTAPDEDSSVEQALTGGALQRVGWYRFYFADERWEWSGAHVHPVEAGERCSRGVEAGAIPQLRRRPLPESCRRCFGAALRPGVGL